MNAVEQAMRNSSTRPNRFVPTPIPIIEELSVAIHNIQEVRLLRTKMKNNIFVMERKVRKVESLRTYLRQHVLLFLLEPILLPKVNWQPHKHGVSFLC